MTVVQPRLRIAGGEIAGTGSGTGVRIYRGIPYAAPPVGRLRWQPPQPAPPWSGVHDGTRFGSDPMQRIETSPMRLSLAPGVSEDCLTLNIWAPADVPAQGAPVIVWFDGGGFVSASASRERITGEQYARRGAVFVTVNYRVGVFGFLAHPALTAESPHHSCGNYGLLDAMYALRWVRENIAAFGGDPKRVTAMGGSAGAAIVALLLTAPLAKGLLDGAILVSPGSFRPLCRLAEAEDAGRAVGNDLTAMRAIPAAELLEMNARVDPGARGLLAMRRLRPIVDGWVVERDEADAFRSDDFQALPTIIGSNADEGGFHAPGIPVNTVDQLRGYLAENFGDAFDEAWKFYGATTDAGVKRALADVWGDALFNYGVRGTVREIARRQPKTFRYVLTHAGKYTSTPPIHGDDIPYVFGTGDFEPGDRAVSDAIVTAFANFAASGDPNGPGAPVWAPYELERDNYLAFEGGFVEGTRWRAEPAEFIDRFYRARAK
jgi:para-nitrobenzyl esterase